MSRNKPISYAWIMLVQIGGSVKYCANEAGDGIKKNSHAM